MNIFFTPASLLTEKEIIDDFTQNHFRDNKKIPDLLKLEENIEKKP